MDQNRFAGGGVQNRLGFIAALTLGALFLLYVFCFAGILLSGPAFRWTGMQAFLEYEKSHGQTLKYISYAGMIVFAAAWAVLGECLAAGASPERKLPARIGASFGGMFALASSMNYFVQLTAVRLNLLKGAPGGLEQFIMSNPLSALESVNMLGWTLLLGLSCLFLAFSLDRRSRAKTARVCLFINAAVCLMGCAAFVADSTVLLAACMYPLLGGAVLSVSLSLCRFFHENQKQNSSDVIEITS